MQPKKNEKADLSRNSSLYFIIGLTSVLFLSWQAIEWKTYDRSGYGYEALNVDDDDDEEIPITEQIKVPPPPPPPPPAPEIISFPEPATIMSPPAPPVIDKPSVCPVKSTVVPDALSVIV